MMICIDRKAGRQEDMKTGSQKYRNARIQEGKNTKPKCGKWKVDIAIDIRSVNV
jgi:hypothetical protein